MTPEISAEVADKFTELEAKAKFNSQAMEELIDYIEEATIFN